MSEQKTFRYLTIESSATQTLFKLNHPAFSATISEFGGQLLSYKPAGSEELIWLSPLAIMDGSKPIRGGAPICWPWFGKAPEKYSGQPQHGYARNAKWQLISCEENKEQVQLIFSPVLDNGFGLSLKAIYTFGSEAKIELVTYNHGEDSFELSAAIHTYLKVQQVAEVAIPELTGCHYFDKLNESREVQNNPFTAEQAMDRVYLYDKPSLQINTATHNINIKQQGHDSIVIWNPWHQGAKEMLDFDNIGYLSMLCVEAALTQGYTLKPTQTHVLSQSLSLSA